MTPAFYALSRWQAASSFKGSNAEALHGSPATLASGTVSVDWVTVLSADKPISDVPMQQCSEQVLLRTKSPNWKDCLCAESLLFPFFLDVRREMTPALTLQMCLWVWRYGCFYCRCYNLHAFHADQKSTRFICSVWLPLFIPCSGFTDNQDWNDFQSFALLAVLW